MKTSIFNITFALFVFLSSFGLQSCKKEATESIAPVNKTIIGKWRAVNGNRTFERTFLKGASENQGTGTIVLTSVSPGNAVTVTTAPFNWDISDNIIHINNIADVEYIFQISADGKRMIFFDFINRDEIAFTFERIE